MFDTLNPETKREALEIAKDILKNVEECDKPLSNVAFKTLRFARLLNYSDYINIFEYDWLGENNAELIYRR